MLFVEWVRQQGLWWELLGFKAQRLVSYSQTNNRNGHLLQPGYWSIFLCLLSYSKKCLTLIQQGKTGKGWQSTASGLNKFWIDPRVSLSWTIFWKTESCNSRSYALNTDAAGAGLSLLWFEDKNPNVRFPLVRFSSTVNLVYNDHPRGAQTMWSLLKCGRCSEVAFFLQK